MATTSWIRGKCLGRGAFGTVHLAFDRRNGDVFAVKSVDASSCLPNQLESLENEIHILRSLPPSPYVVRYLGDDVSKDMASASCRNLHLEYLPGGTVATCWSGKFSEMDERILRSRVKCVVHALMHIHSNGFVHCDVKGRNVLVGSELTVAKLVDFGSAVRVEDLDRSRIVPRGSPLWMAPEVVRGETLGPKSDVWSLGCTVIEMVTGKPAWEDEGLDTLSRIGNSGDLPDFPSQLSELGRDFLKKCLRRNYTERWSCDQLLQHPFLASESADSIAITGSGCSPRCVLDWLEYESEEEDREVSTSQPKHELEHREAAARGVIGELGSSAGPNWESDGGDWLVARGWASDSDRGEVAGSRDSAGAEMELGSYDVGKNNEIGGGVGSGAGSSCPRGCEQHHHHYDDLVDLGGTETSYPMLDCSVKIIHSSNILLPNFSYTKVVVKIVISFFYLLLLNSGAKFHACDSATPQYKVKSMWLGHFVPNFFAKPNKWSSGTIKCLARVELTHTFGEGKGDILKTSHLIIIKRKRRKKKTSPPLGNDTANRLIPRLNNLVCLRNKS